MDDGEQCDGTRRSRLKSGRGCLERPQLAALGAVEDLPAAVLQLPADRIRGFEITVSPARRALVE
jgi:hypothetical protein